MAKLNAENVARVGAMVQMAGLMAAMADSNATGLDDRLAKIFETAGRNMVAAAPTVGTGGNKLADVLDAASVALKDVAVELRGGG